MARSHLAAALALALAGSSLLTHPAHAQITNCRTDPIVYFSNGGSLNLAASIRDSAADVQGITYALYAPAGTSIRRIVYTGGPYAGKEHFRFSADNSPGRYTIITVVSTGTPSRVTAMASGPHLGRLSTTGMSGQQLTVTL